MGDAKPILPLPGAIALIEKGTGTVVGIAQMIDDLEPLSEAELRATVSMHGIPKDQIADAVRNRWVRPRVFSDLVRLSRPVSYNHTSGESWVNLTYAEAAAVHDAATISSITSRKSSRSEARRNARRNEEPSSPLTLALSSKSGAERAAHMGKLPHLAGKSARSIIEEDVSVMVTQRGSKLKIDLTWEDHATKSQERRSSSNWRDEVRILAACVRAV